MPRARGERNQRGAEPEALLREVDRGREVLGHVADAQALAGGGAAGEGAAGH